LLGDVLASAYQQAQLKQGLFTPETVSVGDLFAGALLPGLLLVGLYLVYLALVAWLSPLKMPAITHTERLAGWALLEAVLRALLPPLLLIVAVLGSILFGIATPTEAAAVGAMGALLLAAVQRQLTLERLREVMRSTLSVTSMVFMILIGASIFTAVFRGFGGDEQVAHLLERLPGGAWGAFWAVMLVVFLLGFIIDFIEIIFIVVPIAGPVLLAMGFDPVWLGVVLAINLQTSFLTPPFGFALFYLRGVAPPELTTLQIYRGVVPFILLQLLALGIVAYWSGLATWLPKWLYS
jgi:tripartite ATP-independent transporter DctM subunit